MQSKMRRAFLAVTFSLLMRVDASDFFVSEPVAFNPIRYTSDADQFRRFARVATSGTNALITWTSTSRTNRTFTNVFGGRLVHGVIDDPVGREIANLMFYEAPMDMLAMDGGFFGLFTRSPERRRTVEMLGRYDINGNELSPPFVYSDSTNLVPKVNRLPIAASTGKQVLITTSLEPLAYAISDGQQIVAQGGVNKSATLTNTFVAGLHGDFLYAWREKGRAETLITLVSGTNGINATRAIATNSVIHALGATGSGYLLALRQPTVNSRTPIRLLQISRYGDVVAEGAITNNQPLDPSFQPVILPDGVGWTLFQKGFGAFINYRFTPTGASFNTTPNVYPAFDFAANYPGTYSVAAMGANQMVFVGQVGGNAWYQMFAPTHTTQVLPILAPVAEMAPAVAAGTNGYFVAWAERGAPRRIVGLRLAKDGTRVDPEPVEISVIPMDVTEMKAAFNGTDFVLVWQFPDAAGPVRGAMIAAEAQWNAREIQPITATRGELGLARHGRDVLIAQTGNGADIRLIASNGTVSEQWTNLVNGTVVSDGNEVLHVAGWYPGGLKVQRISMEEKRLVGEPLALSEGDEPVAVVGRDGQFLIVWQRSLELYYARVRNMAVIDQGLLPFPWQSPPTGFNSLVAAAASANDFMIAVVTPADSAIVTNSYVRIDRATGALTIKQIVTFGKDYDGVEPDLASVSRDYLQVTTRGSARRFVTHQWITSARMPTLGRAQFVGGTIQVDIQSDAAGRYRIEWSENLTNWNFLEEQTATTSFRLSKQANDPRRFYRAALVPE